MVDQRIVSYVSENLKKGYPTEQIRNKLEESHISDKDIEEAMRNAIQELKVRAQLQQAAREPAQQIPVKKAARTNKWAIIIPFIILVIMWGIFGYILLKG